MSAPKTNIKKQERQHGFPLAGMAWVVGFAVILLIVLFFYLGAGGNEPGDETPVDADDGGAPTTEITE